MEFHNIEYIYLFKEELYLSLSSDTGLLLALALSVVYSSSLIRIPNPVSVVHS